MRKYTASAAAPMQTATMIPAAIQLTGRSCRSSASAVGEHVGGDEPQHQRDPDGDDEEFVQIPQDRNEVRYQVDRAEGVGNDAGGHNLREPRGPRVATRELQGVCLSLQPARPLAPCPQHRQIVSRGRAGRIRPALSKTRGGQLIPYQGPREHSRGVPGAGLVSVGRGRDGVAARQRSGRNRLVEPRRHEERGRGRSARARCSHQGRPPLQLPTAAANARLSGAWCPVRRTGRSGR
jgi:hypothetical protein